MKPYQIAMGAALAGAAGLLVFGDNTPSTDIAEPVARADQTAGARTAAAAPTGSAGKDAGDGKGGAAEPTILRLTPRAALVGDAGDASFAAGEGLFAGQNWNPPPPPPPPASNTPPPPPMAPPVPFNYFGKAVADGQWEVYLARGDKTYVVRAKTVIDGAYRVERIAPPLMTVTYLPLNQVQQINIGAFD